MTREEALTFLELPAAANAAEIKARIAEKLAFYESESEKAPSDFLRRLNLRNLGKVKTILKDSDPWISFVPIKEEPVAPQQEVMEEPAQTVYIVSSLKDSVLRNAEELVAVRPRKADDPAGWLIMHTANRPVHSYPLHTGKNFIGRKQQPAMEPFIVIEDDAFISRVQCVIFADDPAMGEFYISDASAFNNGKTSKNGTYVNGQNKMVTNKTPLLDGDTIQVGITSLVVRFNSGLPLDALISEVATTSYMNTIDQV